MSLNINVPFAVEDSCVNENYDFGGADIRMVTPFYEFSNYQYDASAWASAPCEIYVEYTHSRLQSF